jgi:hypothetical protein
MNFSSAPYDVSMFGLDPVDDPSYDSREASNREEAILGKQSNLSYCQLMRDPVALCPNAKSFESLTPPLLRLPATDWTIPDDDDHQLLAGKSSNERTQPI